MVLVELSEARETSPGRLGGASTAGLGDAIVEVSRRRIRGGLAAEGRWVVVVVVVAGKAKAKAEREEEEEVESEAAAAAGGSAVDGREVMSSR